MPVNSLKPNFSHIYLEKGTEEYSLTKLALDKFSKSKIIKIDHYKDFFNRSNQDFQVQKLSMNLILAKKSSPFLYPASEMVQEAPKLRLGGVLGVSGNCLGTRKCPREAQKASRRRLQTSRLRFRTLESPTLDLQTSIV